MLVYLLGYTYEKKKKQTHWPEVFLSASSNGVN